LLYLLGIPLALGSWWAFLAFAAMVPFLVWRLFDEEKVLERDLPGRRRISVPKLRRQHCIR
jgi:protein-S-isoprenylcysteine O-methyltransferase Ste14